MKGRCESALSLITPAEWKRLEPFLPVRHAYIVGCLAGVLGEGGEDRRFLAAKLGVKQTTMDNAIKAAASEVAKVRAGKRPMLRPRGCWTDEQMLCFSLPGSWFKKVLADNGLPADDVHAIPNKRLREYAEARLRGLSIREASKTAGWNRNNYLDDKVIAVLKAKRHGPVTATVDWTPRDEIRGRWNRRTRRNYGRIVKAGDLNRAGTPRAQLMAARGERYGFMRACRVCHDMAQLAVRVAKLFFDRLWEVQELSGLPDEEVSQAMSAIEITDWRISPQRLRVYWSLPKGMITPTASSRLTSDDRNWYSSVDIPPEAI